MKAKEVGCRLTPPWTRGTSTSFAPGFKETAPPRASRSVPPGTVVTSTPIVLPEFAKRMFALPTTPPALREAKRALAIATAATAFVRSTSTATGRAPARLLSLTASTARGTRNAPAEAASTTPALLNAARSARSARGRASRAARGRFASSAAPTFRASAPRHFRPVLTANSTWNVSRRIAATTRAPPSERCHR